MVVGGFQEGARVDGWSRGGEEGVWGKGQGVQMYYKQIGNCRGGSLRPEWLTAQVLEFSAPCSKPQQTSPCCILSCRPPSPRKLPLHYPFIFLCTGSQKQVFKMITPWEIQILDPSRVPRCKCPSHSIHTLCHDRDRAYPYMPYPDLSTPIPSHLNHSRAPNAKPEPSDPLASQQRTPEHSDSLASSQHIPDPTHLRPFLSLASSRFPTTTLIPDPTSFDLHSFVSSLFLTFHWSRDCGRAKPDRVPPSLDAS